MSERKAELLLAAIIMIRSSALLFSKIGMSEMGPLTLIGIRFTLAFMFLLLIFWRRLLHMNKETFVRGLALGGIFFVVMTFELTGLARTSSSTTAFIENTAIVMVPIFEAVLCRRAISFSAATGGTAALCGIGLITLKNGMVSLSFGEVLCMGAAVTYATAIIMTDRLSRKSDPLVLGILQVGFIGIFGMIAAFIFETPKLPSTATQGVVIIVLALICTGLGFTLQPVAQCRTSSEKTGMLCALNPVTAAFLGWAFLGENLGINTITGGALVLFGIAISYLLERFQGRKLAPGGITQIK